MDRGRRVDHLGGWIKPLGGSSATVPARLRDRAAAPRGAFHLAMELPMTALRRRMTEDMQILNFAPCTQFSYPYEVSRFARHFGRSPDLLGPAEIRTYCLYLIQDK